MYRQFICEGYIWKSIKGFWLWLSHDQNENNKLQNRKNKEVFFMEDKIKLLVRILMGIIVFIYVVAPDFVPGPIDDAVLILLASAGNNMLKPPKDDRNYIDG